MDRRFSPREWPTKVWLLAGGLLGSAALLAWVTRRRNAGPSRTYSAAPSPSLAGEPPAGPVVPTPLILAQPDEPDQEGGQFDRRRWLILFGIVLAAGLGLLLLPPDWSAPAFFGLAGMSFFYGAAATVYRYREPLLGWFGDLRRAALRLQAQVAAWIDQYRRPLVIGLALASCGLVVLASQQVQPENTQFWRGNNQGLVNGLALCAAAGLCLFAALAINRDLPALSIPAESRPVSGRTNWRAAGTGILLLAVLMEINGQVFHLAALEKVPSHLQFVLLVAGIGLVVRGFGGPRARSGLAVDRRELLLVGGLTLAALVVRFWQLDSGVRIFVDELNFTTALRTFWYDGNIKLLQPFSGMIAFPWLFPYLQADVVAVLGRSFAGMRGASAIMGALTVPALYLLARELFDRRTAVLAALLLITFPPHVHFSRLGLNNIADPLFGTLALAFVARGLRSGQRLDFALGGAMLGLTQYFYDAGRLVYPPLLLGWGVLVMLIWRRRANWRGLLLVALVALIVATPVYYTLVASGRPLSARMDIVGLNDAYVNRLTRTGTPVEAYFYHLAEAVLIYFSLPDGSGFYGGNTPLVLGFAAIFLFLGGLHALRRLRMPGMLLLLMWLAVTSLGNSVLIASMHATRFVIVFPALVLLVAVGARYTLPLLLPPRWERPAQWLTVAVVLAVVANQAGYYFGTHVDAFRRRVRGAMDGHDAVLRAAQFRPGTRAYLISDDVFGGIYARGMLAYFADGIYIDTIAPADLAAQIGLFPHDSDYAFFVEPGDWASVDTIRQHFILMQPEGSPYTDVPPEKMMLMFYSPCCLITPDTELPSVPPG